MTDRTEPAPGPAPSTQPAAFVTVREVKFGKLVQRPRGPVVTGFEHAITARAADLPPDVVDRCRPDLLIPADANPLQLVEPWAHDAGALVIVPMLRTGVAPDQRLWTIVGRVRPYTERGVGQGGRPATLMTAWPSPAAIWAPSSSALTGVLATALKTEPELSATPIAERMARPPINIPARPPKLANVGEIPRPAIVMLDALIRGVPTKWTRATFPDEQAFLDCLAVVYELIPALPQGAPLRSLLSASTGLAVGPEHFLISYVRDSAPSKSDTAKIPPAWAQYLDRSPGEAVWELVARAKQRGVPTNPPPDRGQALFGHAGEDGAAWAVEGLARGVNYYRDPAVVPQVIRQPALAPKPSPQLSAGTPADRRPAATRSPADDVTQPATARTHVPTRGPLAGVSQTVRPAAGVPPRPAQAPGLSPGPTPVASRKRSPEEAAQKAQAAFSGFMQAPTPNAPAAPPRATPTGPGARTPPPKPGANAPTPAEQAFLDFVSSWFARFQVNPRVDAVEVNGLLDTVEQLAQESDAQTQARVRQFLNGRISARHLPLIDLLHAAFADELSDDARAQIVPTLGQVLVVLRPLFDSADHMSVRAENVAGKLMHFAVDHMLELRVLDDRELQGLIGGAAWTVLMPVAGRTDWIEANRPDDGVRWAALMNRSAALQAWRHRFTETRSKVEADVERYCFRWRDEFQAKHGPEDDWQVILDGLEAMVHRTRNGFPPEIRLDELEPVLTKIVQYGIHGSLLAEIDAAQASVLPAQNHAAAPATGAAFLGNLRRILSPQR